MDRVSRSQRFFRRATKGVARVFVVDASVTAAWVFADESSELADQTFKRLDWDRAVVPTLWWYEIRNVIVIGERRGRLTAIVAAESLNVLETLPIDVDVVRVSRTVWNLARRHRLTFYDASYLELAIRRGLAIATLDRALIAAARAERVELL